MLTLVLLVGFAGQSQGLMGMKGMRGTFRAVSGDTEARGNLALNLWFDYWRKVPDTVEQEDMNLNIAVSSSPRSSVELYGVAGMRRTENTIGALAGSQTGLTDLELGLKAVRFTDSWFRPGVNLSVWLPTGKDDFSPGGTRLGVLGCVTTDLKGLESFLPLRAHLNVGYARVGGTQGYRLPLGISLELPSRYFTPVLEVTTDQNLSDTLAFAESPLRFTQGVKATPFRWFSFSAGYDINLARETERFVKAETYDWRIFFGLTGARSLSGLGPQPATVYGTIMDRETKDPVAARITVRGSEVVVESDPETGLYGIEILKEGMLSLVIEAPGYKKRVVPAVATQGKRVERNIELAPSRIQARFELVVTDIVTGGPVPALVRLEGEDTVEARTDASGRSETVELASGPYNVVCSAPGYLRLTRKVDLRPEQDGELVFALLPFGEPMVVEGVTFEGSSANLKIESDRGVREVVELVRSNPGVTFEIGGHTDDTGSADEIRSISLKRAQVFARFLVKGYEIGEESLVTRGYGADMPVADNASEEGRQKNRRVELTALADED